MKVGKLQGERTRARRDEFPSSTQKDVEDTRTAYFELCPYNSIIWTVIHRSHVSLAPTHSDPSGNISEVILLVSDLLYFSQGVTRAAIFYFWSSWRLPI